jgi:hypothetical protein
MIMFGDQIIGGVSGALGRLGIGTTGQQETVVNGQSAWVSPNQGGSVVSKAVYSSSTRAFGTVYQNTGAYPIVVYAVDAVTTTGTQGITDASSTPTTQVYSFLGFGSGNFNPCVFLVMPGNYYKVAGTSWQGWTEYTFNTGTWSASGDLVASRALGTVYHNTGSGVMVVAVVVSGQSAGSTITVVCDSTTTPSAQVLQQTSGQAASNTVFFMVPPGYYYKVSNSAGTLAHWNEYSSNIPCTQSTNLFAAGSYPSRSIAATGSSPAALWGVLNNSGKTRFTSITFNDGSTGTFHIFVDDQFPSKYGVWQCAMPGSSMRGGTAFQLPFEFLCAYQDGGTISASTGWFEYSLG